VDDYLPAVYSSAVLSVKNVCDSNAYEYGNGPFLEDQGKQKTNGNTYHDAFS
jgi:hypothetical protein